MRKPCTVQSPRAGAGAGRSGSVPYARQHERAPTAVTGETSGRGRGTRPPGASGYTDGTGVRAYFTCPTTPATCSALAASREKRSGGAAFDLAAFPEVVRVYAAQNSAAEEIQQQAREARELDVLAVRGLGLIGLNDSLLRACLPRDQGGKGLRVRVALLDSDSDALAKRAAEIGESAESLASGVHLAEARLRELADSCDIGVWRYRMLPTWRVVRTGSTMFVGAFDAGWEGHESATYKVTETPHGPLFRGFRRMFEAVIDGAQRTV
ncbi:XRE family transcriptional regulator [Streptomyces luteolifulvus]|uniref:XRE family transcriptional regulator n=1 Tax=Streptomyces luteolifulvus TaxID=2615112 RepID=UPI001CD9EDBF|nr:XRE family transcriptional regulator [Streptomyces luteolifulvus]